MDLLITLKAKRTAKKMNQKRKTNEWRKKKWTLDQYGDEDDDGDA